MPTPGSGPSIFLNAVSSVNTDMQVTATTDRAPTGGGVYLAVVARRAAGAGDYRVKIRLRSTGQVGISLSRVSATGAETAVTTEATVAGLTYGAQTVVADPRAGRGHQSDGPSGEGLGRVRGGAAGLGNDRVRLDRRLQVPGGVGLMSYLSGSATNAPVVARFDDVRAGAPG